MPKSKFVVRDDSSELVWADEHRICLLYTSGLLAVSLTGAVWIDSAVAALFGLLIIAAGVGVLRKTIANLTDEADEDRLKKLLKTVSDYREKDWIDVHNLKMCIRDRGFRRAANKRAAEMHAV